MPPDRTECNPLASYRLNIWVTHRRVPRDRRFRRVHLVEVAGFLPADAGPLYGGFNRMPKPASPTAEPIVRRLTAGASRIRTLSPTAPRAAPGLELTPPPGAHIPGPPRKANYEG